MDKCFLSWQKIASETVADCQFFSVNRNRSRRIEGSSEQLSNFYVLNFTDWVNVIPVTEAGEVVMVEQFRHGTEEITLEIPGGAADPSDPSPLSAASRELLEETGYVCDDWLFLGKNHPNPALQGNLCHTYLARGARQIEQPRFDKTGTELISLRLVPLAKIPELVSAGKITHALVMVAFYQLLVHDGGRTQSALTKSFKPTEGRLA
jgi:8-oxo-dGTP pyrophosphatase MutT (NUDIX family)